MELLDLYKEENKNLLYSISWLNKNSIFDKSIGDFIDIDLFTFLENINRFDYEKDIYYDDIYYILDYTQDSILHLINNINKEIKREHKIVPISQAKEFDNKSVLWISRQDGRTLREKLSNGKVKSVQRYKNIDTYENRIFKIFLKKLLEIYEVRDDINKFDQLFLKIRKWLRSEEAKTINEYGKIVYNSLLLHHPHYNKIFKSYKKISSFNEKLKILKKKSTFQIVSILKFEILSKLHFKSNKYILPSDITINHCEFDFEYDSKWLIENYNLEDKLKNLKIKSLDDICFSNIINLSNDVLSNLLYYKPLILKNIKREVFIDLFRLFPIARIDDELIKFPITVKQKVNNKIVNANKTKIINLENDIYTLPEVLDNYNIKTLQYFLEDFNKLFDGSKLNYIIPDYVNVFEFTQSKRMINSYFKNNKPIPKSILGGLKYIFNNSVKKDDTLISIQRNHNNELYVTPILVKYEKKLGSISNGLYLERYPTKKINDTSNDILDSLHKTFNKNTSEKLLNRFLQNGLKGIKEENIVFYKDDKIIDLNKFEIPKSKYTKIDKIKELYGSTNVFNNDTVFIDDNNEENLISFEKLIKYEEDGFCLWREHLPDLSMEIVRSGSFDQFILVDEKSELIDNVVTINDHFIIPKGVKELSFPLKFGDENINYKAYLSSKDLPYTQDVECNLHLTYDYERENPYELIFRPLNEKFKNIQVEWKKQTFEDVVLPIPNYPEKKSWDDLEKDPKPNGNGYSDLLDWILERLQLLEDIYEVPQFIIDKEINKNKQYSKETGYFLWGRYNENKDYYCFVDINGEKVYCNSKSFKEEIDVNTFYEGMPIYLNVKRKADGKSFGQSISFTEISKEEIIRKVQEEYASRPLEKKLQPIVKAIQSIKYPLLTVWNNHSLSEIDAPNYFRELMVTYIDLSLKYMNDKNLPIEFKKELFNFLSHLHQDMPIQIANTLVQYSTNLNYSNNLALSIGNANFDWQKQILDNVYNYLINKPNPEKVFDILSIALWRSEILINKISHENIERIISNLLPTIQNSFISLKTNNKRMNLVKLIKKLELLLGILRARNNFNFLYPHEPLTLKYIEVLDKIIKYIIDNKINIKTRIQLDLVKPESFFNIPNILYALRVYLTADTGAANSIKVLGVNDD